MPDHQAGPKQWAALREFVKDNYDEGYAACILELRARVEALEGNATCPHVVTSDEGTSHCRLAEANSKPTPNLSQIRSSEIVPPSELVQQWGNASSVEHSSKHWAYEQFIATEAARWAADQELEACCALMDDWGLDEADLHAARRPKPPSLKEQALSSLTQLVVDLDRANMRDQATILEGPIRRALEQLDD